MSAPYKENRIARPGSTRRVSLLNFKNDGVPVTSVSGGEYIRFTVYLSDGSLYQATTAATYDVIYTDTESFDVYGWTGIVDCPATEDTLSIIWELFVDGKTESTTDTILVQDT